MIDKACTHWDETQNKTLDLTWNRTFEREHQERGWLCVIDQGKKYETVTSFLLTESFQSLFCKKVWREPVFESKIKQQFKNHSFFKSIIKAEVWSIQTNSSLTSASYNMKQSLKSFLSTDITKNCRAGSLAIPLYCRHISNTNWQNDVHTFTENSQFRLWSKRDHANSNIISVCGCCNTLNCKLSGAHQQQRCIAGLLRALTKTNKKRTKHEK